MDFVQKLEKAAEIHNNIKSTLNKEFLLNNTIIQIANHIEKEISNNLQNEINNGIAFPTGINIDNVVAHYTPSNKDNYFLLIDGNYFKPVTYVSDECDINYIDYETIKGGDNLYCSIAAASILAKVDRDKYIDELCEENPDLITKYSINTNKGYAAKKHRDGITEHGISKFHRKTYGICKKYS